MSKSNVKRLIILDLNGLLIHRVHKSVYVKHKPLFQSHYSLGNLPRPEQKGNFAVWFRPNIQAFLTWLMDNFHVAIWSSVLKHNIEPIVQDLFPNQHERNRLLFWWNQEHCHVEDNPTATDEKNARRFFKRLSSVWDSAEINESWSRNQPSDANLQDNTLLIDDNALKVRDNPINTSIHPRSWKLFDLEDDVNIKIYEDHALETDGQLMKWLKDLLEWDGTVSDYVKDHPYVDPPLEEIKTQASSSWDDGWG